MEVDKNIRVALVHDWLTGMRGGEKCLEGFCEIFPDADIYTLLHIPGKLSKTIEQHRIHTSFIQKMPFAKKAYRNYLPFFPTAIEQFDLRGYDLVLSSSHCVAKGVITQPTTCHFSYIHTPMRYVWEMYHDYFADDKISWLQRKVIPVVTNYLRMWDVASSNRVDGFIANSHHVARRIRKHYNRESSVINPPVETERFQLSAENDGFFLIVSALTPYKKIDLAIETFNRLALPLKIVGTGEQEQKLKDLAGPTVEVLGWQPDEAVSELYRKCRAFIFPQEEDFGITPLEAQACGKPVIAFGKGGALETVVGAYADDGSLGTHRPAFRGEVVQHAPQTNPSDHSGVFFRYQTLDSLTGAVKRFLEIEQLFVPEKIRSYALTFDRKHFIERSGSHIMERYTQFREHMGSI